MSGWWYVIDRDVTADQKTPVIPEATILLSSLTGTAPMLTSWMLASAGLARLGKNASRAKVPKMTVDVDAWKVFIDDYAPVSYTHLTLPTICSV